MFDMTQGFGILKHYVLWILQVLFNGSSASQHLNVQGMIGGDWKLND